MNNIENLQRAVEMLRNTPGASLTIEAHRVQLTISNKYTWEMPGVGEVPPPLDCILTHFFEVDDKPKTTPQTNANRPFVVIVQSNGICDYAHDAACGHHVAPDVIEAALADYRLDGCYTLVFNLDGRPPYILHNSAKNP